MRKAVHPFAQNYSASRLTQIKLTVSAVPHPQEGASRSSRTLGTGCDGRTSPSAMIARTNGGCADGEVVWSWRSDAGAKVADLSANDGGNQAMVTEESTKETVKTIAQGMPVVAVYPWLLTRVLFAAHAASGATRIRHSLR